MAARGLLTKFQMAKIIASNHYHLDHVCTTNDTQAWGLAKRICAKNPIAKIKTQYQIVIESRIEQNRPTQAWLEQALRAEKFIF